MRLVLLAVTSALAAVGCEREPAISDSTRALSPVLAASSPDPAAPGESRGGQSPNASPTSSSGAEPTVLVELDGIDDGTGVAPAPPGVGTSSGAARREDGLNAGREGNVNLNEEFMDDVDDTTDVSGVPERSGASDDPAVVADERFTTKPLDEDRAARSKPGNEPAVKAP